MAVIHSFDPVSDLDARVLILGSMPGKASLAAQAYYAYPRNAFWRIMGDLLGLERESSYAERTEGLIGHGIALWDVMQSCTRESSLDSDIVEDSIVANDFRSFFETHRGIERVYFNGAKAEHAFRRYVLPELGSDFVHVGYARLPSTSPAHAGMGYEEKLEAWRVITS